MTSRSTRSRPPRRARGGATGRRRRRRVRRRRRGRAASRPPARGRRRRGRRDEAPAAVGERPGEGEAEAAGGSGDDGGGHAGHARPGAARFRSGIGPRTPPAVGKAAHAAAFPTASVNRPGPRRSRRAPACTPDSVASFARPSAVVTGGRDASRPQTNGTVGMSAGGMRPAARGNARVHGAGAEVLVPQPSGESAPRERSYHAKPALAAERGRCRESRAMRGQLDTEP